MILNSSLGNAMMILWIVLIIITIVVELETTNLVTIWFTIGAVGALISSTLGLPPFLQVGIFALVSLILLILTRPLTRKMMKTEIIKTNADKVIGMNGIVTKAILPNEIGEIKVDHALWRAINLQAQTFEVGEKAQINAISGIKLIVSKIDQEDQIKL